MSVENESKKSVRISYTSAGMGLGLVFGGMILGLALEKSKMSL